MSTRNDDEDDDDDDVNDDDENASTGKTKSLTGTSGKFSLVLGTIDALE